jgi:hypothetical protein
VLCKKLELLLTSVARIVLHGVVMLHRHVSIAVLALLLAACHAEIGEPLTGNEGTLDPDPGTDPDREDPVPVELSPSNIPENLLTAAQGSLSLNATDRYLFMNTDTGDIIDLATTQSVRPIGVSFVRIPQPEGPDLGVFSAVDLVISSDTIVLASGASALVFALSGSARIDGIINAGGGLEHPTQAGPGGYAGGTASSTRGKGAGGGQGGGGIAVGGGGGGHLAAGGRGGDRGTSPGGEGGAEYGKSRLVPLVGGSGGGYGGGLVSGGKDPGYGGGGGGAVQISALGGIVIGVQGGIYCGGAGGEGSTSDDGGGGGGAGGAILLEAGEVVVLGTLAANGGGGGAGGDQGVPGAPGEPGRFGAERAPGGQGVGEGQSGGAGGAGEFAAGEAGGDSAGIQDVDDNAGGGGGAGGRIEIRATSLSHESSVISPSSGFASSSL